MECIEVMPTTELCPQTKPGKEAHRVAGVGAFDSRKSLQVRVKHVHLLHQTRQSCLCGFTNLFINTLSLELTQSKQKHRSLNLTCNLPETKAQVSQQGGEKKNFTRFNVAHETSKTILKEQLWGVWFVGIWSLYPQEQQREMSVFYHQAFKIFWDLVATIRQRGKARKQPQEISKLQITLAAGFSSQCSTNK